MSFCTENSLVSLNKSMYVGVNRVIYSTPSLRFNVVKATKIIPIEKKTNTEHSLVYFASNRIIIFCYRMIYTVIIG